MIIQFTKSKRIQELKRALKKVRQLGIWGLYPSKLKPSELVITGDGIPLIYLKPLHRNTVYQLTEINALPPFWKTWKVIGQKRKLSDLIQELG